MSQLPKEIAESSSTTTTTTTTTMMLSSFTKIDVFYIFCAILAPHTHIHILQSFCFEIYFKFSKPLGLQICKLNTIPGNE